jgi:hypothetical protein
MQLTFVPGAALSVTKLYNHVNSSHISATEMVREIDQDGDGDMSYAEVTAVFHRAGAGLTMLRAGTLM